MPSVISLLRMRYLIIRIIKAKYFSGRKQLEISNIVIHVEVPFISDIFVTRFVAFLFDVKNSIVECRDLRFH